MKLHMTYYVCIPSKVCSILYDVCIKIMCIIQYHVYTPSDVST